MKIIDKVNSIKNQELTATENLEQMYNVIQEKNDDINAFVETDLPRAQKVAEDIDKRIKNGEETGKLAGLVIGIKSNINVEDYIISAASPTLKDYIGSYNATVINKIQEEDGVIIGLTNMDEFAAGSSTETSMYGPTDNPSAPGHIPGGSSGGSAAAIASGMCDIALGSDTGGSIRNPASHCGVTGFKPTYGLVSRQGLLDLAMSLDQIGPLAKDVTGIALMLDVITGYDPYDPTTMKKETPEFLPYASNTSLDDMTVGVVKEFMDVTDDKINNKINQSIDTLSNLGAEIKELTFEDITLGLPTYYLINYVEFFSATRKYDGRKYGERIEEVCGPEVSRRIQIGSYISQKEFSGKYYKKALQARSLIRNDFNDLLGNVDIIAGPTVPKLPHKIGEQLDPMDMYAYDVLTVLANITGIPAGSMKAGLVDDIPVGIQLQAKPEEDYKVIKTMSALENN
ncbi:Asp-tRNA(Asn)/Glu-tRNA(Gln) amidotransferase subunit GatA [uncultured Methanosphaera sp.]|uniref:Asp-tRNA(Asn)/Glu-tRNA(Gln) amidotransferase subunit GatA n=1 Tax=uncultured Methanosphaera sp. TaxID=262501 RepID=UPI000DC55BC2|nr:Asp-tRNA(Asn)/Glu-tRNA(Gln) amidotransferase subunit GatA [uncultured Methanosphaera sp.]RAP43467.1 MAG: glutaminyl-tRNA synthase (glutamine-hydrolyzing) subunit A [Methanosphaera sp. SHI1033]